MKQPCSKDKKYPGNHGRDDLPDGNMYLAVKE